MPTVEESPAYIYFILDNDILLFGILIVMIGVLVYKWLAGRGLRLRDLRRVLPRLRRTLRDALDNLRASAPLGLDSWRSDRFWSGIAIIVALVYLSGFLYYSAVAAEFVPDVQKRTMYKVGDLCTLVLEYPGAVPLERLRTPGRPFTVRFWVDTHLGPLPPDDKARQVCVSGLDPQMAYVPVIDVGSLGEELELTDANGNRVPPLFALLPAASDRTAVPTTYYLRQKVGSSGSLVALSIGVRLVDRNQNVILIEPQLVGPRPVIEREGSGEARWRHFLEACFSVGLIQWIIAAMVTIVGGWRILAGSRAA